MMKEILICLVAILGLFSLTDCNTSSLKNKKPEKADLSVTDSIEVKLEMVTNAIEAPIELNCAA